MVWVQGRQFDVFEIVGTRPTLSPFLTPFRDPVLSCEHRRQVLSVRHPQRGTLELGFTIVVPPGRLGQFTKVVQFWPRLLVVNRLPQALVLEQNSTLRYSAVPLISLMKIVQSISSYIASSFFFLETLCSGSSKCWVGRTYDRPCNRIGRRIRAFGHTSDKQRLKVVVPCYCILNSKKKKRNGTVWTCHTGSHDRLRIIRRQDAYAPAAASQLRYL